MNVIPNFKGLSDESVVASYGAILDELRDRKIIRTKNVLGDLGEFLAVKHYKADPTLPNLQPSPAGTQNVDALSRDGERYSIKSTSGNSTGVFYGFPEKGSTEAPVKKFEHVIIVKFSGTFQLERIIEISWEQFLKYRLWQSRMRAWYLGVNAKLCSEGKVVFKTEKSSKTKLPKSEA